MNTKSVLVLAGASLSMTTVTSVTPTAKKASQDTIAMYLGNNTVYNPFRRQKDWQFSENRKAQIQATMDRIHSIRKSINLQARRERNKKLYEEEQLQNQQIGIHVERLVDNIMFTKGVRLLTN